MHISHYIVIITVLCMTNINVLSFFIGKNPKKYHGFCNLVDFEYVFFDHLVRGKTPKSTNLKQLWPITRGEIFQN